MPSSLKSEIDRLTPSTHGDRMPSQNSPAPPAIDLQELLARVDDDRQLLYELLSMFKEEFPRNLRNLRDAIRQENCEEVARLSHTLKGTLANLAAAKSTQAAARLEQAARSKSISAMKTAWSDFEISASGLLPQLEACMAEAPLK